MHDNSTRRAVFLTLVEEDDALTPTEIGDYIGETRQTVKYNLDKLVESGLVVRKDEAYQCQPVFTDDEFEGQFVDLLSELVPEVGERIQTADDVSEQEWSATVFNCIRMYVALELLEPPEEKGP